MISEEKQANLCKNSGNHFGFTQVACIVILLLAMALSGCGGSSAKKTGNAFDDHHKPTIITPKDSCAWRYAIEHGIPCEEP